MALTHDRVWSAIDFLANRQGLTTAALAKKAGLDPTSLNPSKRRSNGRARWPSTETIAKLLSASSASLDDFMDMPGCERETLWAWLDRAGPTIPRIPDENPVDVSADEPSDTDVIHGLQIPEHLADNPRAFVFRIIGDNLLPIYRDDTLIIVAPTLPVGPGHYVLVRDLAGNIVVRLLNELTEKQARFVQFGPLSGETWWDLADISAIERIIWASQ